MRASKTETEQSHWERIAGKLLPLRRCLAVGTELGSGSDGNTVRSSKLFAADER